MCVIRVSCFLFNLQHTFIMKWIFSLIFTLFLAGSACAQIYDSRLNRNRVQQAGFDESKLYYGGYVDLSLGSITTVGATPLIGYKLSPQFSVGTQLSYKYISDKQGANDYSSSNYGASLFSRYRIIPQLYVHAEYSMMNYEYSYWDGGRERDWVPFLLMGGGYSQPVSEHLWLNAQVLFDVLQDENSPYDAWEPFWSVGFGVGF